MTSGSGPWRRCVRPDCSAYTARVAARAAARPSAIAYPDELPITARRQDLPEGFEARAECPEAEAPVLVRRADGSVAPDIARVRLALGFPPGI